MNEQNRLQIHHLCIMHTLCIWRLFSGTRHNSKLFCSVPTSRHPEHVNCTAQETHGKTAVMTELTHNGSVSWLTNPHRLEDRNSLAKLLFQADCKESSSEEMAEIGWGVEGTSCINLLRTSGPLKA